MTAMQGVEQRSGVLAGSLVAAAVVLVAVPVRPGSLWWVVPGFAVVLAAAVWARAAAALRVGIVAAVIVALFHAGLPPALGTVLVCVALLSAYPLFARLPALAPERTWLVTGRFTPAVWGLLGLMVVGSAAALVGWSLLADPPPPPFFTALDGASPVLLVLAVVGFSLVNSVWEEAFFRGIVQSELAAAWGTIPAVIVQAVAFGIAHLNGFPSGWTGVLMSGGWGLLLGVLRVISRGMAAPYAAHVCADATIGIVAVAMLG
jgi:membrane protease YdiL (CAAX protease family)